MPSQVGLIRLPMTTPQGQTLGSLKILARTSNSLFRLSEAEAIERGEEPTQLLEGRSYEFALELDEPSRYRLRETLVVQPSQLSIGTGRIEPALETGLLPLILENNQAEEVLRVQVEVRTAKLDYHRDYRHMLDYIANKSINLLMDIHAPSQVRMITNPNLESSTIHERFAFLRHLLSSQAFQEAINRILAMPHHRTEPESVKTDIRRGMRPGRSVAMSMGRSGRRTALPPSHPLYSEMLAANIQSPSLPVKVESRRSIDSRNTPENQFVKHALNDFWNVLMDIEEHLRSTGTSSDLRLLREVTPMKRTIAEHLEADLFKEVDTATILPLGSPVLQRRNGYREILESWLRFTLAAQLSWSGGDDVFGGGKKDVALLYEYWLFFVLLELVTDQLNIDTPSSAMLIELTNNGFDMKLKAGTTFSLIGAFREGERPIRVRFSYNRTFSGNPPNTGPTYPRPGSWTRSMRPDFTLSFWPSDFSESEAERKEFIVHVHFDAKYRVEGLRGLFGIENAAELDDEDSASRSNAKPKRSDLLKMHAYRDAIRRTEGAFVLYPGPLGGDYSWAEYHEILPGLGAFAVRPGNEEAAKKSLAQFIGEILRHVSDPTTRREQQSHHTYRIQSHE